MTQQQQPESRADDRQVDGDHYRKGGTILLQHWDFAAQSKLGYFEGVITKHLDRYADKGEPLIDLQKADHYLQKLGELAAQGCPPIHRTGLGTLGRFLAQRPRAEAAREAIILVSSWALTTELARARELVGALLKDVAAWQQVKEPESPRTGGGDDRNPRLAEHG